MNFLHELVPLLTPFVPLLVVLIWPITTLIILYWFKETIRTLLTQLAEAKFGDKLFFKFWQAKSDLESVETLLTTAPIPELPQSSASNAEDKWGKVADVFWLGSDLDWTAQTVLRAAPKERILHGLTQSYHHASQSGLSNTVPGKHLATLKSQVQVMQESALDRDWRANFVEQLYQIIKGFSDLAKERQTDFRPSP
jgi:hypothetical protein